MDPFQRHTQQTIWGAHAELTFWSGFMLAEGGSWPITFDSPADVTVAFQMGD